MTQNQVGTEVQPLLVQDIFYGPAKAHIVAVALELKIFDLLYDHCNTAEKIAKHLSIPLRSSQFLLDALVGVTLLRKHRGSYRLNDEAELYLVSESPRYLGKYYLDFAIPNSRWEPLMDSIKTGKPQDRFLAETEKAQFYQDLAKRLFSLNYISGIHLVKKMGVGNTIQAPQILDIACGAAPWSIPFALTDGNAHVTALDIPEVIPVARDQVDRLRLTRQFDFVEQAYQDFDFKAKSYDIIVIGHLFHIIGESESKKLVKSCYQALNKGGKLVIAEFLVNDLRTGPDLNLIFALNMLMFSEKGDVFSPKELKRWLSLAGFKKSMQLNLLHPCSAMLATK